jgi:phytoene dehydrogenase-like protein
MVSQNYDVIVIGAGHNGLITATFLGRNGLKVLVLEGKAVVGGAVRTEYPYARAPQLAASTGAYLIGVMPPELIDKLGIKLTLLKRDPYYFLPTLDNRYLLFGSNTNLEAQFKAFFSEADWHAHLRLQEEIGAIRDDIAPALLSPPLSLEETADKYLRPSLQEIFIELCRYLPQSFRFSL